MAQQIIVKPLSWFHADPTQPRNAFDEEKLRQLNSTLLVRQLVPVIAKADGTLIDGERRWRAAKLGGVDSLEVVIVEGEITPAQVKEIQLITSLQKADLKPYEQFLGCMEWMKANPDAKAQNLAVRIGRDPSTVSKILSLARCIPAVQEAAKAGFLGISDWAVVSKVSEQQQHELLAAKLNGASRDELESRGRKARNGGKPTVRVSRVKCQMPSGVCVTFTGEGDGLTLDDVIETLSELLKEAKKANDQGLDSKTFSAVMRDKSKAG